MSNNTLCKISTSYENMNFAGMNLQIAQGGKYIIVPPPIS
jgi:hypothetical protein